MYGSSAFETIVTSATFAASPLKLSRMISTIPVLATSSAALIAMEKRSRKNLPFFSNIFFEMYFKKTFIISSLFEIHLCVADMNNLIPVN